MPKYETHHIRNIALVGHSGSGKTTLADTLLYKGKAVPRAGSIEDGTSVFDFEPEEKDRKVSIDLAIASCSWQGCEINLFDVPGYSDFVAEAVSALHAVETAVLCVNAEAGVMVNTRKMWDLAKKIGVGRMVVINKMDLENVQYPKLMESILESLGRECVPVVIPNGWGPRLSGVVNVIDKPDAVPGDLKDLAASARERLMEIDDALLEKYLEGGTVTTEEIVKALPGAVGAGKIVPVLCTSARKDLGLVEFLDFVAKCLPSPKDGKPRTGEDPQKKQAVSRECSPGAPLSGQVFKVVSDPFVGKLSYLRISSGTLNSDQPLTVQRVGRAARIGALFKPFGREQRMTSQAIAGDVVVVTKVDDVVINDTICEPQNPIRYPEIAFPTPMVSLAIEPKSKQDLARLSESLQKMASSDPTFKASRDPHTGELLITAMSQLHMDVILIRLKRKYQVELITKTPKIAFKEAILGSAEGHHKHKKQTGGHGQYGEVKLRIEPAERGAGFVFEDAITQGRIPQQYVPAVEKGIRETLEKGVIAGCQVVDVKVTLFDGSYHEVDSGPESFKLAGSKAFKKAFLEAKPTLLEPIVSIEIVVPTKYMGDITGDLNSRRGRIMGMDTQGNLQMIRAQIPMMEIMNYSTELRSTTGGEGSYSIEFSNYDVLPSQIAQKIIEKAKKAEEEEEE